jgi:hypothetical protein
MASSSTNTFNEKSYHDYKITCIQYTGLVNEIKEIYGKCLTKCLPLEEGRQEILALLHEHEDKLLRQKTNIVSLFPHDDLFIHINQTYFSLTTYEQHVNLNMTLTPSPSGHRIVLLVHPNIVINDSLGELFDLDPHQYVVRPIYQGKDATHSCVINDHHVDWSYYQCKAPLYLQVHPHDKIIFHARDNLDYTVTSSNSRYEIPINPLYDLRISPDHDGEVILDQPGNYYFVSRQHKKSLQLYVHVKDCPYHVSHHNDEV